MSKVKKINLGHCEVDFYEKFYSKQRSAEIKEYLSTLQYEYTYYYMAFAREGSRWSRSKRKMLWFTENTDWTYFFSNNHIGGLKARNINDYPFLLEIKSDIEKTLGQKFNALLINEYVGGKDRLDWHNDNDKWLGPKADVVVPSLSFGSERDFQLRIKKDNSKKITIKTVDGSLMVMKGLTQAVCEHQVPVRSSVTGVRYNLTFRYIHPKLVHKMPKGSGKTLEEASEFFPELKTSITLEEEEDFDKECGFWLYNRPYVWIQGPTRETSGRLYLYYDKDTIHIYTRKGFRDMSEKYPERPFGMMERRIPYSGYKYHGGLSENKFDEVNVLDIWGNPHAIRSCSWATRYFGIYIPQRDGDLKDLEVRRNGVKFILDPKSNHTITEYLKAAGFHTARGTNFIKLPTWLQKEKGTIIAN